MMKKMSVSIALAGLAISATTALAAAQTTTGEIKSIDAAKHEMTLASGETFTLGSKINAGKFKAGEKVSVKYTVKDGKSTASSVHAVK